MWVVIHRLEPGGYQCIGDYTSDRNSGCLSHNPTTFDSNIIGVFDSRGKANEAAMEYASDNGFDCEDEEEEDVGIDFVGEGLFIDGGESSGDVNTFSQRLFVERHTVR